MCYKKLSNYHSRGGDVGSVSAMPAAGLVPCCKGIKIISVEINNENIFIEREPNLVERFLLAPNMQVIIISQLAKSNILNLVFCFEKKNY
jgi:hypothetical protein